MNQTYQKRLVGVVHTELIHKKTIGDSSVSITAVV